MIPQKRPLLLEFVPANVRAFLAGCAARYPEIEHVAVFGSRARNDARPRSDFDFAVLAPDLSRSKWARFALEIEENLPTLCGIDLLRLDEHLKPGLREKIDREGIIIYERPA